MLKLNTPVTEVSTGLRGRLTGYQIFTNRSRFVRFQPHGLNDEGQPTKAFWVCEEDIDGGINVPEPDLPIGVLGTKVEDQASGYKGTAVALILHVSGCVHVEVQPEGKQKTGDRIAPTDFDVRRLKGRAIQPMNEEEREADQKEKPSPSFHDTCRPCR